MIDLINVSIKFLNEVSVKVEREFTFYIILKDEFDYSLR